MRKYLAGRIENMYNKAHYIKFPNKNYYKDEAVCEVCEKTFKFQKSQRPNAKYCSKKCAAKGQTKGPEVRKCEQCPTEFEVKFKGSKKRFCSHKCSSLKTSPGKRFTGEVHGNAGKAKPRSPRVIKQCPNCKNSFETTLDTNEHTYCSNKCQTKYRGKYHYGNYFIVRMNKSVYYRSSYEFETYKRLEADATVADVQDEPLYIPYLGVDGKVHRYLVDILVTYVDGSQKLIEVKPEAFIEDETNQRKFEALLQYTEDNGLTYEIWTEESIFDSSSVTTTCSQEIVNATEDILLVG